MMERLTEKQSAGYDLKVLNNSWCWEECNNNAHKPTCRECGIYEAIQKLGRYEDLEEQGRLIKLPVPIRTGWNKYYWIDKEDGEITILNDNGYRIFKPTNDLTVYEIDSYDFPYEAFGKTVFLTEAEAEEKLKELSANEMQT